MVTDTRLSDLAEQFGRSHAQAVWDAGLAAIARIDDIVRQQEIECGFDWVEGYLHLRPGDAGPKEVERLEARCRARSRAGLRCGLRGADAPRRDARSPLRRPGASAPAPLPGGARSGHRRRGRPHPRAHRRRGVLRSPALRDRQRSPDHLRRYRDRDAQPAGRCRRHHRRHAVPDQARAVLQLRGSRPSGEGRRPRRAAVGHRRPLSLLPRRAPPRPRRRDPRRRRPQDRPGQRHRGALRAAGTGARRAGAGHRARRTAGQDR